MDKEISPDWALIQKLGGPAAVARELKMKETTGVQTVQNWKYRGIPARVKLSRPDLFLPKLIRQLQKARA
jgi:hypothetical protein